ncbi:MAG TPA: hypothetical protein VEY71_04405 [Chitinophagales bacterium]|nr:hypothetical protein [Chitinophagales bacterium]
MKPFLLLLCAFAVAGCKDETGSFDFAGASNTGKNGSITRFAIHNDYMYAIDLNYLRVYNLVNDDPYLVHSLEIDYGLETIFIHGNRVFLGAVDGVYLVNIDNPAVPFFVEKLEHHISCDPVVVQGNYAYSTQRVTSVGCGNAWQESVLAVYNVDPGNENGNQAETILPMEEPYGLAVENEWLFVCDAGRNAIVVYELVTPETPVEKTTTPITQPRDIILLPPYMIVSTQNGFEIFNYADPLNMQHLSSLVLN